jgi:hypothetical protein
MQLLASEERFNEQVCVAVRECIHIREVLVSNSAETRAILTSFSLFSQSLPGNSGAYLDQAKIASFQTLSIHCSSTVQPSDAIHSRY